MSENNNAAHVCLCCNLYRSSHMALSSSIPPPRRPMHSLMASVAERHQVIEHIVPRVLVRVVNKHRWRSAMLTQWVTVEFNQPYFPPPGIIPAGIRRLASSIMISLRFFLVQLASVAGYKGRAAGMSAGLKWSLWHIPHYSIEYVPTMFFLIW